MEAVEGDGESAAAEAADLDQRLICLATGLQPAAAIARASAEEVSAILAEDERAAEAAEAAEAAAEAAEGAEGGEGGEGGEAAEHAQAAAESAEWAISRLETRLNIGLAEPERFEALLEAAVAAGHLQAHEQLEQTNREAHLEEAGEAAARAARKRAQKKEPLPTAGGCPACRGRHVRHTCGRGGWGK